MMQTNFGKNVYRYLPRPVGELLVYYLWIILPFWQIVKGHKMSASWTSRHLFSEETIFPMSRSVTSKDLWSTNALSEILKKMTRSSFGSPLNTQKWRQMAIAFGRKYLRNPFFNDGIGKNATDEDDLGDDDILDLQAAHSTQTALKNYGRLILPFHAMDPFREISIEWHKLLIPHPINSMQGSNDIFTSAARDWRRDRLAKLMKVDLRGRLQLFMNADAPVDFRGNQREVLEAIVSGSKYVLQIAPTGTGKSLSFMLPAYCSPNGTSIVIVPLISLQNDLLKRCKEKCIPAMVWKQGNHDVSPNVVLVTPESAVTHSFKTYMNTLSAGHYLDRIIVDECHSILFGNEEFRPNLPEIKHLILSAGVQIILLTATLPPKIQSSLFDALSLPMHRTKIFLRKYNQKEY